MQEAIKASESQMITVAMKRVNMMNEATDDMLTHINREHVQLLPNTSGVRNAKEAVLAAQMSREIFETNFIKPRNSSGPQISHARTRSETLKATEELCKVTVSSSFRISRLIPSCANCSRSGNGGSYAACRPIGTNKGVGHP